MKKIGKVVSWIFGVLWILVGLLLIGESFTTFLLLVLAGILFLPPVRGRLPEFKGRKPVLCLLVAVFSIAGLMSMPESRDSGRKAEPASVGQNGDTASDEQAEEEELLQTGQGTAQAEGRENQEDAEENENDREEEPVQSIKKLSNKEIKEWIAKAVAYAEDENGQFMNRQAEEFKSSVSEKRFKKNWMAMLMDEVADVQNTDDKGKNTCAIVTKYVQIYDQLWGKTKQTKKLSNLAKDIEQAEKKAEKIEKKDSTGLISEQTYEGEFYITSRLETNYEDNLLGKLQKEFESYQLEESVEWVAYDVEFIGDTAYPNWDGNCYVIQTGSERAFSREGAYYVTYVDSTLEKTLVNSSGFQFDAPVYLMIENASEFYMNQQEWYSCKEEAESKREELISYLSGGSAASTEYTLSGTYTCEQKMAGGESMKCELKIDSSGTGTFELETEALYGEHHMDYYMGSYEKTGKNEYYGTDEVTGGVVRLRVIGEKKVVVEVTEANTDALWNALPSTTFEKQ